VLRAASTVEYGPVIESAASIVAPGVVHQTMIESFCFRIAIPPTEIVAVSIKGFSTFPPAS
jgi:hypothetical protein